MSSQVGSNGLGEEKQLKIVLTMMYFFSAVPLFNLGLAFLFQSVSSLNGYWVPQFSNLQDVPTIIFIILNVDLVFSFFLMASLMNSAESLELKRSYGRYLQALVIGETVAMFLLLLNLIVVLINYQKINLVVSLVYTFISIILCLYATFRFKNRIAREFS